MPKNFFNSLKIATNVTHTHDFSDLEGGEGREEGRGGVKEGVPDEFGLVRAGGERKEGEERKEDIKEEGGGEGASFEKVDDFVSSKTKGPLERERGKARGREEGRS